MERYHGFSLSTFIAPANLSFAVPFLLLITLGIGITIGIGLFHRYQRYQQRVTQSPTSSSEPPNNKISQPALLAMLSHEIRTPLHTILGMVELPIQSPDLTGEDRQYLTEALQAIEDLQNLLDDILDLSRFQTISMLPTELSSLLTNIAKLYHVACTRKGLAFHCQLGIDEQRPVLLDTGKFRQILNNLLSNAVKFTQEGTVTLIAKSYALDNARMHLEITISDTGIGINEHDLQHLFKPFSQAEDIRPHFGGTGLGLYISQQLTHLMGGKLTVESRIGEGTRVHLKMELLTDNSTNTSTTRTSGHSDHMVKQELLAAFATDKHALIVDDSDAIRHLLKRQLERMGFTTTLANSGQEAEQLWYPCRFDLILVDYHMPGFSGPQLVSHLRALEKRLHDSTCAIIGFTADTKPESEASFLQAGASLCLNKPVRYGTLHKAVRSLVDPTWLREPNEAETVFHWFDNRMLKELSNGDLSFEKTFLLSVQKNNRIDIDEAKQAYAAYDEEHLSSALHRLSGILRLISHDQLTGRLLQVEKAVRERQQEVLESLLEDILKDLQLFDDDITVYLKELELKSTRLVN